MWSAHTQDRKYRVLISAWGLFLCCFCGCVQVEETLYVQSDGSGVAHVNFAFSQSKLDQLLTLQQIGSIFSNGGAEQDPVALFGFDPDFTEAQLRDEFEAYRSHGVSLQSVDITEKDDWKITRMKIGYQDIKALTRTPLMDQLQVQQILDSRGNVQFRQALAPLPREQQALLEDHAVQHLLAQFASGIKFQVNIITPSPILKSNGTEQGQQARWSYTLNEGRDGLNTLLRAHQWIIFQGGS